MTRKQLVEDDASQYDNIQERLRRLEQGIPEDVHYVGATGEPAFQNSWVNFDNSLATPTLGQRNAGFYRFGGRVYLMGVIKSGASGTVAFTLPLNYRYSGLGDRSFVVAANAGYGIVAIKPGGEVLVTNGTGTVGTFCWLEGVSFRHA